MCLFGERGVNARGGRHGSRLKMGQDLDAATATGYRVGGDAESDEKKRRTGAGGRRRSEKKKKKKRRHTKRTVGAREGLSQRQKTLR